MVTKKSDGSKLAGRNAPQPVGRSSGRKPKVQTFAQFQPESEHKRLDEMIDQTIYITRIERQNSEKYGSGFKLHFKDLPNARDTYTAACYGQYVVPALENMFVLSHDGKQINSDNPVKVTIRQAGRTYRFE